MRDRYRRITRYCLTITVYLLVFVVYTSAPKARYNYRFKITRACNESSFGLAIVVVDYIYWYNNAPKNHVPTLQGDRKNKRLMEIFISLRSRLFVAYYPGISTKF